MASRRQRIMDLTTKIHGLMEQYNINEYRHGWAQVEEDTALQIAIEYLGPHYKESTEYPGIFYNQEGARVRMMQGDLEGHNGCCPPHINIDTIYSGKGFNYHLELVEDI